MPAVPFPRVCRDDPVDAQFVFTNAIFSPRMRGWSRHIANGKIVEVLFPAYAGEIPAGAGEGTLVPCSCRGISFGAVHFIVPLEVQIIQKSLPLYALPVGGSSAYTFGNRDQFVLTRRIYYISSRKYLLCKFKKVLFFRSFIALIMTGQSRVTKKMDLRGEQYHCSTGLPAGRSCV